ncbi:MAG: ABC transporter substrate-binding protein [Candidatus Binatia bacterium]
MKHDFSKVAILCLSLGMWQPALAATVNSPLAKAKSEAEAKGYIFYTSHDQIVSEAKKEGKLKVLTGLGPESIKAMTSAFKGKYPFIDVIAQEAQGVAEHQRILLELKAGMTKWDTISMANDLYNEYIPYQRKFDILGMAEHGVLQIHPKMIDPKNRNVAALTANIQVGVAFNKNLIAAEKTPNTWEDYLKPEFKGKKFLADIRPTEIAALVPAWGLEKTLAYARKLAAQEPVWVSGGTRGLVSVVAGEYPMFMGTNYKTIRRLQQKDPAGVLQYKFLEPVPVRPSESVGVITTSGSPNAALLWIEFLATAEGQKIMDELGPFAASIYGRGSIQGQEIRGKELSLVDWEHYMRLGDYQNKVVAAYGFPKAELKK